MAEDFYPFVENASVPSGAEIAEPRTAARIAVYDDMTMPPRVVMVEPSDIRTYLAEITKTTYELVIQHCDRWSFQVIRELVENLIHASFSEPTVSILDRGKTLVFSDQGPGIPDKKAALKPSFSSATAGMKRYIRGVGSGLPIVEEWLRLHNGTLSIEDNLGCGTTITVSLSRNAAQGEPEGHPAGVQSPVNGGTTQGYQPRGDMYGQPYAQPAAPNGPERAYVAYAYNPYAPNYIQGYGIGSQPYQSYPTVPGYPIGAGYRPNQDYQTDARYPFDQGYPQVNPYGQPYPILAGRTSGFDAGEQAVQMAQMVPIAQGVQPTQIPAQAQDRSGYSPTASPAGAPQPGMTQGAAGPFNGTAAAPMVQGGPAAGGSAHDGGERASTGLPTGIDAHVPLTVEQRNIIVLFGSIGKVGPKELNDNLAIATATGSRKLKELAAAGYIVKSGQKYVLTGEGQRVLAYLTDSEV